MKWRFLITITLAVHLIAQSQPIPTTRAMADTARLYILRNVQNIQRADTLYITAQKITELGVKNMEWADYRMAARDADSAHNGVLVVKLRRQMQNIEDSIKYFDTSIVLGYGLNMVAIVKTKGMPLQMAHKSLILNKQLHIVQEEYFIKKLSKATEAPVTLARYAGHNSPQNSYVEGLLRKKQLTVFTWPK